MNRFSVVAYKYPEKAERGDAVQTESENIEHGYPRWKNCETSHYARHLRMDQWFAKAGASSGLLTFISEPDELKALFSIPKFHSPPGEFQYSIEMAQDMN